MNGQNRLFYKQSIVLNATKRLNVMRREQKDSIRNNKQYTKYCRGQNLKISVEITRAVHGGVHFLSSMEVEKGGLPWVCN